jgi:hypothetical protein
VHVVVAEAGELFGGGDGATGRDTADDDLAMAAGSMSNAPVMRSALLDYANCSHHLCRSSRLGP